MMKSAENDVRRFLVFIPEEEELVGILFISAYYKLII